MSQKRPKPERRKNLSLETHVFTARLPLDVWEALQASAEREGASVNAELVRVLRQHYGSGGKGEGKKGRKE